MNKSYCSTQPTKEQNDPCLLFVLLLRGLKEGDAAKVTSSLERLGQLGFYLRLGTLEVKPKPAS